MFVWAKPRCGIESAQEYCKGDVEYKMTYEKPITNFGSLINPVRQPSSLEFDGFGDGKLYQGALFLANAVADLVLSNLDVRYRKGMQLTSCLSALRTLDAWSLIRRASWNSRAGFPKMLVNLNGI